MAVKQPSGLVRINWGNVLASPTLETVLLGTAPYNNLVNSSPFTTVGTIPTKYSNNTAGPEVSKSNYFSTPAQATSAGWTMAMVVTPTTVGTADKVIGVCQVPGSGTNDRALAAGLNWGIYIFDGGLNGVNHANAPPTANKQDIIVIWATGSEVGIAVNGIETTGTASNSGYTGYAAGQVLCAGNATSNASGYVLQIPLLIRDNSGWSKGKRQEFYANPWQILTSAPRRLFFGPAAGAAANLMAQACL
jgi:hypothetical protein